jgi:hypothetical protein
MPDIENFIHQTLAELNRLHRAYLLADSPTPACEAQAAYHRFWADSDRCRAVNELYESGVVTNSRMARQLWLMYLSAREYRANT